MPLPLVDEPDVLGDDELDDADPGELMLPLLEPVPVPEVDELLPIPPELPVDDPVPEVMPLVEPDVSVDDVPVPVVDVPVLPMDDAPVPVPLDVPVPVVLLPAPMVLPDVVPDDAVVELGVVVELVLPDVDGVVEGVEDVAARSSLRLHAVTLVMAMSARALVSSLTFIGDSYF